MGITGILLFGANSPRSNRRGVGAKRADTRPDIHAGVQQFRCRTVRRYDGGAADNTETRSSAAWRDDAERCAAAAQTAARVDLREPARQGIDQGTGAAAQPDAYLHPRGPSGKARLVALRRAENKD